jgi:hypothetical protein
MVFDFGPQRLEETTFPGVNRPPTSDSHPHQSNGEMHYLRLTQAGFSECCSSLSQENAVVKIIFSIKL